MLGTSNFAFWYFRYALSISGIFKVIAHNIKIFLGKLWSRDPSCKGPIITNPLDSVVKNPLRSCTASLQRSFHITLFI